MLTLSDVVVKDPATMHSVACDGRSLGEIMLRGSSLMKGYVKDEAATKGAFNHRWFATGDVGVVHLDGYVEIKDRSKDVIISVGENISSVEVEAALYGCAAVSEVAVVAMPHKKWGECPCAFVKKRGGSENITEGDIIRYCRENLPGFMVPKKVCFVEELPKTSTGKVKKFQLRDMAKSLVVEEDGRGSSSSSRVDIEGNA